MEAGLQVFNDSGTLQIDSTYYNMCLKTKGAVVTSASGNSYTVDLTLACTSPMMAFRCTDDFAYLLSQRDNGNGTWTFRFGSVGPSKQILYYLFDIPTLGPSSYGMQVFNPQGYLVFDVLWPYLLPVAMYQDLNGDLIGRDIAFNGPAGRVMAVIQNYMGVVQIVGWEDPSGSQGPGTIYNVSISGTTCKFTGTNTAVLAERQIYYAITGTIGYTGGGGNACYLLVDVTGL